MTNFRKFCETGFSSRRIFCNKRFSGSHGDYINSQKWPYERIKSRRQVNKISDRLTQAYSLSAAWLENHEYGAWIKKLPVFEHMSFPIEIDHLIKNSSAEPNEKTRSEYINRR